jgi:hypothetical protein
MPVGSDGWPTYELRHAHAQSDNVQRRQGCVLLIVSQGCFARCIVTHLGVALKLPCTQHAHGSVPSVLALFSYRLSYITSVQYQQRVVMYNDS